MGSFLSCANSTRRLNGPFGVRTATRSGTEAKYWLQGLNILVIDSNNNKDGYEPQIEIAPKRTQVVQSGRYLMKVKATRAETTRR